VFRGLAIAGMVLVNNPGSWDHLWPPLRHAEWHGCTPTDLVFPFFLFIVGVAMAYSLSRYTRENRPTVAVYGRILRRSAVLFALGLLLNGFPTYEWEALRLLGVLQRIALAYLLASLLVLNLSERAQRIAAGLLLLGYWAAMTLVPVPGFGPGALTPEGNLGAYLDRTLLGSSHLYARGSFDPEGLFGTLGAVVTVLIGFFTGRWLRSQPVATRTSLALAAAAVLLVAGGWLWGLVFPINKQLWTGSYVLFTGGWALLLLALCFETIEVRTGRAWGWPFEVFGLNAIALFVGSGLVGRLLKRTHIGTGEEAPTAVAWIYTHWFAPWVGATGGSFAYALVTLALWWLLLYGLYRRGWFFKV
jgi:predicted acyltransferase